MATRRIKDITNTATTFASDDFIALDGATQGTRKMDKDDLIAEVSAGVSGDYLEEANNLSDVASLDTSKLNMEIPDVGTAPDEVPLNGMLGDMAYQSSEGISVARAEVESTTGTATTQALTVTDGSSTKFVVQEDGKVGVGTGTLASGATLDVNGAMAIGGTRVFSKSSTDLNVGSIDGSPAINTINFKTADTVRATIDSSGRVGIGNSSPGAGYSAAADDLVVGDGSGDRGLTIVAGTGDNSYILFADGTGYGSYRGRIQYNHNADQLYLGASANTNWKIDGATGNFQRVTAGAGIDFGSTTTGTGTVTGGLLNDYEFGDFTVTAGGAWTVTPTSMGGRYVKVGNLVTCWVTFGGSPSKTSATSGWLEGLPFATNVYPGQGSVSDTSVVDRGNCYAANVNRLWLTGTSFGVNSYATVTYRHD